MAGRVLVVGSANVDIVLRVPRLPGPGETVLADSGRQGFGGKGANQAVAAARAGAHVTMVGRLGDDPVGTAYKDRLAAFGVDVRHLLRTAGRRTGTAYVMVDEDGENSIVVDPGANAAVRVPDLRPLSELGPADVLLVQCELPPEVVAAAVRLAHDAGARVVLNLAPFVPLPDDVFPLCDPVVVNEDEAFLLDLARGRRGGGLGDPGRPGSLVVTRGAAGARWDGVDQPAIVVPEDEVVDTTGAGDAFCGTLAAALAAGSGRQESLAAAVAAGAEAVRRMGAQPAS